MYCILYIYACSWWVWLIGAANSQMTAEVGEYENYDSTSLNYDSGNYMVVYIMSVLLIVYYYGQGDRL